MDLLEPSTEQLAIVHGLEKNNINVDAIAGSGKTTTNLYIASKFKNKKLLLLTYNKDLKFDSRKKASTYNINNLEVHSYHSFCVKYYYNRAYDDNGIIKILENGLLPIKTFNYDIIILDEVQDLNILYYELICKLVFDNDILANICVLGDKNQCINSWNQSDWRYIKYADRVFNFNDCNWKQCTLSRSFRITNKTSDFLNKCLLKDERMTSLKEGVKPRYVICDSFGTRTYNRVYQEVIYYINMGYAYHDFFILAPSVKNSVKSDSPVRHLANILSDSGISIYVPNSDEEQLDKRELEGKIVFSTFHQAKGRERKVVIVFNFDISYFTYYAKDKNPYECPNELYVACTRSLDRLSIIHHYQNDYLPFIDHDNIQLYTEYDEDVSLIISNSDKNPTNFDTSVTELTKHLPSNVMKDCLKYFNKSLIQKSGSFINIPQKTRQGNLVEGVSDITGVAIASFFEYKNTGKMSIYNQLNDTNRKSLNIVEFIEDSDDEIDLPIEKSVKNIKLDILENSDLLFIATKWNSFKSGYTFKLNQIVCYDWLSNENLIKCIHRLQLQISNDSKYEVKYIISDRKELLNRRLKGFFDCIDNNKVWELKCVKTLRNEHFLQLAIYMYMHKRHLKDIEEGIFIPFNIGDIVQFRFNYKNPFEVLGIINNILDNGPIEICFKDRLYTIPRELISEVKYSKFNNIPYTKYTYLLFNVLTDEIYTIDADLDKLEMMMEYIIQNKYYNKRIITDNEFLDNTQKYYNKYYTAI